MLLLAIVPLARAGQQPETAGPLKVRVGVYVIDLGKLDTSTGSFTADFYLMFESDTPFDSFKFEFLNGRSKSFVQQSDDPAYKAYRIQAELNEDIDLRSYPFDGHDLAIRLAPTDLTTDKLNFESGPKITGLDPALHIPGWRLDKSWRARVDDLEYDVFGGETYSTYTFSMHIGRPWLSSFLKGLLPALFIMLVGFIPFFMQPDKAKDRLGLNTSCLVGTVLFHLNLTASVPPIGYLTYADKFMIANYVGAIGSLVATVTLIVLFDRSREACGIRVHKLSRILVPGLWLTLQTALLATLIRGA